eukprot:2553892-Prymnesium_polylepis.2
MPARQIDISGEILASRFCLCPSGTGWGMRVFHARPRAIDPETLRTSPPLAHTRARATWASSLSV